MLSNQKHRPRFTGGLDAKLMKPWIAKELRRLKPTGLFFFYDKPQDYDSVIEASKMLWQEGFTSAAHSIRCYVLIGYATDTFEKAETRSRMILNAGLFPMAMLYRNANNQIDKKWQEFQRQWARPHLIALKAKGY